MKLSEILQAFHGLEACDRVDLICRMLRHCLAFESRFLGTVLLDASKEHYKSQVNKIEIHANRVSYYKPFQESGLSHQVCLKLCSSLSVVHSDNRPVAEVVFQLLNDKKVLTFFEDCNELKVLKDFRLLYVMAVNHPALSFNQRQLLMYTYLQRMDLLFIEKSKYSFSGSFSGSVEKSLTGDPESSRYPPEMQFSSPAPDAYITRCDVHSVYRRSGDKRYVYMVQVEWSDGATYTVRRTYGDFFSFQTKLLDLFPEEGGQKGKKHPRMIPYLPGKNYQRFLKGRETAEKRLPELHRYSKELISLPEHIHRSHHVLEFFRPRLSDKTEEYPPLHKITTLYDLLESGKVRSRVFSEPLNGSPTHSPITHSRGLPPQRAALSSSAELTSSRVSQTLPPPAHTPLEESIEAGTSVIPRRPTYPLNRKSAFNPVPPLGRSGLSEDDLASTATLVSEASTVGGMSSDCLTPTSHLSLSSTSLTAHTPTQQVSSTTHTPRASITDPTPPVIASISPQRVTSTQDRLTNVISTQQSYMSESPLPRHPVAVLQHSQGPSGVPLMSGTNTVLVPMQQPPVFVSTSPHHASHDARQGQVVYSQGGITLLNARDVIVSPTSPTSMVSNSSPTLMCPNTTHGSYIMGPANQIIGVAPPYSPIPTYPFSPSASPVLSPKMPKMYGSYNAVNHPPTEQDSLIQWLKSLRLHKYYKKFENVTFDEMCSMSLEQMETRGMTSGAAKKLHKKLEELQGRNFGGFRDMPLAAGMTRKPSTCSLPASLLMERGLTPSSSFEGFSPTGSTCSLDKFGSVGRMPTPSQHSYRYPGEHHERQHSRSSCSSAVIEESDAAILRAVPFNSSLLGRSDPCDHSDPSVFTENMPSSSPKTPTLLTARKNMKTVTPIPTPKSNHTSGSARSPGGPGSVSESSTSWADQSGSNENSSVLPDWAVMPANGEVKHNGHKHIQSKISGGMADSHHIIPIRTNSEQSKPFQQYNSQERVHSPNKSPHTPSRSRHTPVNKRNSFEGYISSPTPLIEASPVRQHKPPVIVGNRTDWAPGRHDMLQSTLTVVRTHPNHQQTIVHRVPPQYINGAALKPVGGHHGGVGHSSVLLNYGAGGRLVNHRADPGPVTCFNCGKRGHLGMTCPANTMETNDPDTFHKKLESLVHTASKSPVL